MRPRGKEGWASILRDQGPLLRHYPPGACSDSRECLQVEAKKTVLGRPPSGPEQQSPQSGTNRYKLKSKSNYSLCTGSGEFGSNRSPKMHDNT